VKTFSKTIALETKKQFDLVDITAAVKDCVAEAQIKEGIALVYSPHTTAAVRINHNEPLLAQDIMKTLYRLVPIDISYSHDLFEIREHVAVNERSNGHSHVKAFLLGSSESLVISNGGIMLGEKQSIFFVELDGGRQRSYLVKIIGE